MPRLMRCVSRLMRMICTFTVSPMLMHFGRVIDALVADVGDVEQAVDAAEVDERAVIGDVLDHALDHLALGEADWIRPAALLGAGFLEDRAARHDDVAAAAVHLQDLERLRQVHQRPDVADRADVDLAARAGRRRRRRGRR